MKCKKCKKNKEWTEFYINPKTKSGFSNICKDCYDGEKESRYQKYKIYLKKLNKIEQDKKTYYLRNYNITIEQYNDLYKIQSGKCLICGIHQSELDKSLCIDHNHETGEIRGLLCGNCNSGLGFFKDTIENLEKAIEYLKLNI